MNQQAHRKFQWSVIALSGIFTFAVLMLLFLWKGLAPFGTKSLVVMDANIQYLDFFSYYKDVLSGDNSILYSFEKTLGGSCIAVFSYYLSSPFNLLLFFFQDSQLHSFFDLAVALKLSLAAMTFAFFSTNRLEKGADGSLAIFVLTAMGYGLCQYTLAQSSNIMWLDGVYMLPLILLQISNLVRRKKAWPLPFLVGAAIIFNWYSAGINCIFSAFWFLFESILYAWEEKAGFRHFIRCAVKYVAGMVTGVLMSAALFLPTIGALRKSTRGSLRWDDLKDLSFLGEFPSAIQQYSYGAPSSLGSVALFCGSLALILALFALFCREISLRKRALFAGLLFGSLLSFYWHPLYTLFSLFQRVGSYHYRYSYTGIFSILFLALIGSQALRTRQQTHRFAVIALVFAAAQVLLHYCNPTNDLKYVYATAAMIVFSSLLLLAFRFAPHRKPHFRKAAWALFLAVGILDLSLNAHYLMKRYSADGVTEYQSYRQAQEETISAIQSEDDSLYRITQTSTRNVSDNGLTAYYNEGLAYGYPSISGYTSSPDDIQREFLDKVGYPMDGANMCITDTSILGADSLLGVKYVLSSYDITGLVKIREADGNGKAVYLNPYALPAAFTYTARDVSTADDSNPFAYQNALYRELFGCTEDLYTPLEYSITPNEDGCGAVIRLDMPVGQDKTVYGSIPWKRTADSSLYLNGEFLTAYACRLSPTVFYIPDTGDAACEIEVKSDADNFDWDSVQFYALNLDVLQKCAEIANAHQVEDISIENGCVTVSVQKDNERLFLSIPADDGWTITLNGEPAQVELVGDCLYSIQLTEGTNNIRMTYHVRYLKSGILLSVLTVLCFCAYLIIRSGKLKVRRK